MHKEIRLSGFGGQGIILSGHIIGKAFALYANKFATFTQNYGPESRGGSCSAQLIVSDDVIDYPDITTPDILVSLSQAAYFQHIKKLSPNGLLIYEKDLVDIDEDCVQKKVFAVPATNIAEELGRKVVANVVMIGFFGAVTDGIVAKKALKESLNASVPPGTETLNLNAFEKGFEYGQKLLNNK